LRREIGWVGSVEDTIDIRRRTPEYIDSIGPIGHEGAFLYELSISEGCGKAVLLGGSDDKAAVDQGESIGRN
jgi:hypothetical protein